MFHCKPLLSILLFKGVYEILINDPTKTHQWSFLPMVQAAQYCPCSDCGTTTRCYNMNHTIVPVRLPTSGVETLYLHGNRITKIYRGDFREFKELELLALDSNVISEVDRNAFVGLDGLKTLHLEHNLLSHIPEGTFINLKKLKNLFLNDNQFSKYPGDLPYLESIEKLNVDSNKIEWIHWSSFINQKKLKTLNLWKNLLDCDCNTKQLIKWLTKTSRGRAISIPSPPEVCVGNHTNATRCDPVKINKVHHVDRKSNVYLFNDNAILHCDVSNNLMPYWLTPGAGRILPYSRGRVEAHINGTLKISNLIQADNGTYTCVAQYVSSSNRKTMQTKIVVVEASKPAVGRLKQDIEVFEGETATLKCDVTGVPEPTIRWLGPSQAKPISQSNFTEGNLRLSEDNTTLTILGARKENQGIWRCKATNSEGSAVGERRLKVMVANDNATMIAIATVAGIFVVIVAIATVAVCRKIRRKRKESQEIDGGKEDAAMEEEDAAMEEEDAAEKHENESSQIAVEENDKENQHKSNPSVPSKPSEKICDTEIQEETIKQHVKADTDLEPEPNEDHGFVLSFVPGSDELQQPFEYEPEIKGFRL